MHGIVVDNDIVVFVAAAFAFAIAIAVAVAVCRRYRVALSLSLTLTKCDTQTHTQARDNLKQKGAIVSSPFGWLDCWIVGVVIWFCVMKRWTFQCYRQRLNGAAHSLARERAHTQFQSIGI